MKVLILFAFAVYCFGQTTANVNKRDMLMGKAHQMDALGRANLLDESKLVKRDMQMANGMGRDSMGRDSMGRDSMVRANLLEALFDKLKQGALEGADTTRTVTGTDDTLLNLLGGLSGGAGGLLEGVVDVLLGPDGVLTLLLKKLEGLGTLENLDFDPETLKMKLTIALTDSKSDDGLLGNVLDGVLALVKKLLGPNGLVSEILKALLGKGSIEDVSFDPDSKQLILVIKLLESLFDGAKPLPKPPVTPVPSKPGSGSLPAPGSGSLPLPTQDSKLLTLVIKLLESLLGGFPTPLPPTVPPTLPVAPLPVPPTLPIPNPPTIVSPTYYYPQPARPTKPVSYLARPTSYY